jgi:hypothetical protein
MGRRRIYTSTRLQPAARARGKSSTLWLNKFLDLILSSEDMIDIDFADG